MTVRQEAVAGRQSEIRNQIVYDGLSAIGDEREVSVPLLKPRFGRGNVLEQPLTMGEGYHEIQITLPDGHWCGNLRGVKAPAGAESQIVVYPSIPPIGETSAHTRCPY